MRRLLIYWAYTSLAGLALSTRVVVHAVRSFVLSCSPFRCWPGNDKNKCKNVISTKDDLYRDKKMYRRNSHMNYPRHHLRVAVQCVLGPFEEYHSCG